MDVLPCSTVTILWALAAIFLLPDPVDSVRWLAISNAGRQGSWNRTSDCRRVSFLSRGQRSICRSHIELMPAIVLASTRTVGVCQELFTDRRWNCSSMANAPNYLPDLTGGTREQAFVYALSAASVVHSISRACAAGISNRCSCGGGSSSGIERRMLASESGDFRWEGCSDNLEYGLNFSQQFTDAQTEPTNSRRVKVNLHNYFAGRKAATRGVTDTCKCHGVSGSCSLRTCWRTMADLSVTGRVIQRLYDSAVQVNYRRLPGSRVRSLEPALISNRVSVSEDELVFFTQSPDYCLPEEELGSVGTKDRVCQKNVPGSISCRSMCCGRGHWTNVSQVQYRCDCKYYWCCYVKCNVCTKTIEVHRCY